MARNMLVPNQGWLHPDAPHALAADAAQKLSRSLDAAHMVKFLIAHPPNTLDATEVSQRNAILTIAYKILITEANCLGDDFCRNWNTYRRMIGEA